MISKRTREALAAAKARGQRLGNPSPAPAAAQARAVAAAQLDTYRATVRSLIAELHGQGFNLSAIAREMNRRGIKTARGRQWEPATIRLYVPTESAA